MISISAIRTVVGLVPSIIDAIKVAEQYIRGKGRGEEKKRAAIENVIEGIKESVEMAKAVQTPDFATVRWFELVLKADEFTAKIGAVVDSVVALMNFLSLFDDIPDDPKLVN